jgi:DHA1 family inner membrane transport protein
MNIKSVPRLVWIIGVATLSRLSLNTARRFVYPFAPALSRGLGVPLTAITSAIAINQVTGVLGLFFGPFGDFLGYRMMMLSGVAMLIVGMFAGGFFPFYGVVVLALFLAGMGKSVFDPALHAYVGQQVPYQRRGLVIGVIEFGWAGSSLVGIPLVGLLIERLGWRSPFFALGGLALLSIVALNMLIPKEKRPSGSWSPLLSFWRNWRRLGQERVSLGMLGCSFFVGVANDNLFVIYGVWLENSFGLSIVALGVSTIVIGMAELLGEGLTASLADRLGLRRSIIMGLVLSGLSYVVLPLLGNSLPLALTSLFVVFLTVEFTIVTSLSFSTEILPDARATMMAGYLAAANMGRVFGALIGGPVWMARGILATGLVSAFISCLGLLALIWGVRGQKEKINS